MARLDEVRNEIEQLCEEIARDALALSHDPGNDDGRTAAPTVHVDLVVSKRKSRVRLRISIRQAGSHKRG
ncbi:hypothetical protein [Burkholderia cenocepacia]|uniref:hypothetical protein n=1 Tax=Burkholderia cenocepacia TaxID=95486 RepID=UPI002856ED08|nr:hypothetical protein [Burkholderia cenocepacia]MDR5645372.1 hypothetical protein [Burkholderia cenocepacia]